MKIAHILTTITAFILLACNANQARPSGVKDNKSLLWKISGKNSKPSYLFGTIHIICQDDYLWTDVMKKSLKETDEVCFEMDMDDPGMMMQVATAMIDNSGKTLKDYFTPDQYARLSAYMKDSMGTDISLLQNMKPAALVSLFSAKSFDCATPASYEANIMEEAKKQNKEIVGLEEAKEQIDLLLNMPVDTVVSQVMDNISPKNADEEKKELNDLIAAYKKQDLPHLYEIIQGSKDLGDMSEFLDDRNKKWIGRMKDKMNVHSVFFAVGAGHLWGDNGVIRLLRNAGYTVEAVK
ncbi:TraB/GumN family protein [Chitinophagaceae bacterium MMS25-I14]